MEPERRGFLTLSEGIGVGCGMEVNCEERVAVPAILEPREVLVAMVLVVVVVVCLVEVEFTRVELF